MIDDKRSTHEADFQALLDFLNDTPKQLADFTGGLTEAELRGQNSSDEFSVLENVCHLRDLELQGYTARIDRILSEAEPTLADFDGARVAAESHYHNEQLVIALNSFTRARRENVAKLGSLSREQVERAGKLEGVGRITLRRLAEMMREHDEGHLEDLRVLSQRLRRRAEIEDDPG